MSTLLTLGGTLGVGAELDPAQHGLGPEHIPELIRLATDQEILKWPDGDDPMVLAPALAWQALAKLHAVEAVEPLLHLLEAEQVGGEDWYLERVPTYLGEIGPETAPILGRYLLDTTHPLRVRLGAVSALRTLGRNYPEARAACIPPLTATLEVESDQGLNGWTVAALLELKAVEAAPVIEKAFAAGRVGEWICGDWPRVRYELGLTTVEPPPRRYVTPGLEDISAPAPHPAAKTAPKTARDRLKAKRKQEKEARKRQRKNKRK